MIISDLPYFGSISFIQSLIDIEQVCFDNTHPFSKMSFKNRMVIATAQGPLHLSIPIQGGRDQKSALKEIRIAYDTPWHDHHFKALVSNYQRAPYFEYYQDQIRALYNLKPIYLVDYLSACHEWTRKQLKGKWETIYMTNQINNMEEHTRIFDQWLPKNYFDFPNPIKYQQVFEDRIGFLPNLSILDLLFCCGGKHANHLMQKP
jgi:hypothetical protein